MKQPFVFNLIDTPRHYHRHAAPAAVLGKSRRGPKPKEALNPNAALIRYAVSLNLPWIDDAVMASMYITVGASNGKLNVRPAYVRRVIGMDVISVAAIMNARFLNHDFESISERYAQYLSVAGRFALYGIERYLRCNPVQAEQLRAQFELSRRWDGEYDLNEADYLVDLI